MNSKYSSTFLALFLLSTIIAPNLAFTSKVEARPCGSDWLSRMGCTLDPTNPRENGSIFQSSFNIYVTNSSPQPIIVTVRYMDYYEPGGGSCSTVDGGGENCPPTENWTTQYWNVNPGENVFIIDDAVGRYAYFSAKSQDGSILWDEKEVDMGPNFTKFTYTFNYGG